MLLLLQAQGSSSPHGGVFDGESYVVHPKNASNTLVIPLRPQKDIATDLEIHALVGARGNNEQFHVFKLPHKLPKFAMFAPSKGPVQRPSSSCVFTLQKQVRVIANWLANQITLTAEDTYLKEANAMQEWAEFTETGEDGSIGFKNNKDKPIF